MYKDIEEKQWILSYENLLEVNYFLYLLDTWLINRVSKLLAIKFKSYELISTEIQILNIDNKSSDDHDS